MLRLVATTAFAERAAVAVVDGGAVTGVAFVVRLGESEREKPPPVAP